MVNTTAIRDSGDAGGYHKNSGQSQVSRSSCDQNQRAAPMMGVTHAGPQPNTEVRVHQRNGCVPEHVDGDLGRHHDHDDDATMAGANPSGLYYRQAPSRAEDNKRARSQALSPQVGLGVQRAVSSHLTLPPHIPQAKAERPQNFPFMEMRPLTGLGDLGTPASSRSGATSPQGLALAQTPRRVGVVSSFREAEPSRNLSPAWNDQAMGFSGLGSLGTPTEAQSVQSYRTADLLPDSSTPFGYADRQAQQIHELHTANGQLQQNRNTLASELHAALAANQLLVGEASASPTKAMLQSMVAEANRSAALTAEQRATMVRQMATAEERVVQLESWVTLAQSQVSHCANAATSEKVLLNEALTEVDRLKRRVIELTQELAEMTRREAGKYTGDQIHELRTTLNRDHETRHIAFEAESDNIKQKSEKEIADQREQIRKLQNERTTQAKDRYGRH